MQSEKIHKMKSIIIVIVLFISIKPLTQTTNPYQHIDKKIAKIPDSLTINTAKIASYINENFKTDIEKIRAVFYFTTSNISYDVKNMLTTNNNLSPDEIIQKTLSTKKGVCINYAEVFNKISNKVGVKSVIIYGYTKQNGKIDTLSHAWCGAYIDKKWFVFDPTWGAGYIINKKFVKKIDESFFKADPSKIIGSHVPFDFLWQFLNYPITNDEFYKGHTQINKSKKYFDYEKEIALNENYSEKLKLATSVKRIEENGIKNAMIVERLNYKKIQIENIKQAKLHDEFKMAADLYNESAILFQQLMIYREQHFKPTLPDAEIKKMIEIPKNKLMEVQNLLNNLNGISLNNRQNLITFKNSLQELLTQVDGQEAFVNEYINSGKLVRAKMFAKVRWNKVFSN